MDTAGDHHESQNMTCKWDRMWTETTKLMDCDWVQCLKPPTPPASVHLRVNYWDGKPIEFGDTVEFVCERGHQFEDDPGQESVTYTCQGNTESLLNRGFFDSPLTETEWPRCIEGNVFYMNVYHSTNYIYLLLFSAPLCPVPPEKKFEGNLQHNPKVIDVPPEELCAVDGEPVNIKCHSFLNIHIVSVIYGRKKANGNILCNGKEDSVKLQSQDCLDVDSELESLHTNCKSKSECKSYWVKPIAKQWTGECNETLSRKNELTVQYRCGKQLSIEVAICCDT